MAGLFSLISFAGFAAELAVKVDEVQREALKAGAEVIEKEAKRVIGTYDYGWPQLAQSTQTERSRLGYPANEPLLREGNMRDSIEHTIIDAHHAEIGSDSDIAVYQELGTATIPARSFLAGAAVHKEKEIAQEFAKKAFAVMTSNDAGVKSYLPSAPVLTP